MRETLNFRPILRVILCNTSPSDYDFFISVLTCLLTTSLAGICVVLDYKNFAKRKLFNVNITSRNSKDNSSYIPITV